MCTCARPPCSRPRRAPRPPGRHPFAHTHIRIKHPQYTRWNTSLWLHAGRVPCVCVCGYVCLCVICRKAFHKCVRFEENTTSTREALGDVDAGVFRRRERGQRTGANISPLMIASRTADKTLSPDGVARLFVLSVHCERPGRPISRRSLLGRKALRFLQMKIYLNRVELKVMFLYNVAQIRCSFSARPVSPSSSAKNLLRKERMAQERGWDSEARKEICLLVKRRDELNF
ncbi:hypothetical protein EVAR_58100_1 [Eumeta japonica]|uniref:Uncharacterized protein n=1 Tax=Eumeta variegata TaxID=151549 RepID=A0A4C1YNW5_EUMVA|nr:hypothetical protein EVAR_58100_1 [Eumeta japonica]